MVKRDWMIGNCCMVEEFVFFGFLLQWVKAARGLTLTTTINNNNNNSSLRTTILDKSWRWVFQVVGAIQLIPLRVLSYFVENGGGSGNSDCIVNNDRQEVNEGIPQQSTLKQHTSPVQFSVTKPTCLSSGYI